MPANRRTALRSQRSPKSSRSVPTTPFRRSSGTIVTSATPSVAMMIASVPVAAIVPRSDARHPRVTPTARTMVVASTNSTALATNAGVARIATVRGSTLGLSDRKTRPASWPTGRVDNHRMTVATRVVRAPRGTGLSCLAWPQEAAFRMIQNNLDPDVAEKPDELIVYGATGRAARSWRAFDRILETLRRLRSD